MKRYYNYHGLMLLRSTSKHFLGTYYVLRSGPSAVGDEAKRRMKKQPETLAHKPQCARAICM